MVVTFQESVLLVQGCWHL